MNTNKTARIFRMPLQFPCGPEASCCGPTGQSDEEIQKIVNAVEKEIGCNSKVYSVTDEESMKDYSQVAQLVRTFGQMALPVIILDEEVVSMGNPTPEQAVAAIKEKINLS